MIKALGWCSLVLVGGVGCGGNSGSATLQNDPVAMRAAPAGLATLAFLDLETSLRPDVLPVATALPATGGATGMTAIGSLPSCVQVSTVGLVTTFSYSHGTGAGSGDLSGTIQATLALPSVGTTVYTQVFNLTSVLDATRSWHYQGTQTLTIIGATATVSVVPATAINVVYSDSGTPANSRTYVFTPDLNMSWAVPGRFLLNGSYGFVCTGGDSITATIPVGSPLTWTLGCDYPSSGTLALALSGPVTGKASTSAVFGPGCGQMTISGGMITLGSH